MRPSNPKKENEGLYIVESTMQIGKAKMTISPPLSHQLHFAPQTDYYWLGGRVQKGQNTQIFLLNKNWGTCCKFLASARAQLKGERGGGGGREEE